jgi:tRNA pseudouridine55 synthase
LGFATDTYDADGTPAGPDASPQVNRAEIERLAAASVGRFAQMPPPYSAKKIHGRPAHELARKKKPVELKAADIEVYDFHVNEVFGSTAKVSIECSAGTYVRSLAHDMGAALGCGAHLAEITRTAVGEFTLDQAASLEDLESAAKEGNLARYVIPLERLLPELPSVTIPPLLEHRVRHGSKFSVQVAQIQPGRMSAAQGATTELNSGDWKPARLRVFNHEEHLIAIAEALVPRTYQPVVVLDAEP